MKRLVIAVLLCLTTGCASLQTPRETNIAVSSLLDEIQIAINEIASETATNSSLPPFNKAEINLSTAASITTGGSASLVLSGEKAKTATDSTLLSLELVPNLDPKKSQPEGTGHSIAKYVIAAVRAVDEKNFLKLKSLTVQAGLLVHQKESGGIEVKLVGITVKGGRSKETENSHSLKLFFSRE